MKIGDKYNNIYNKIFNSNLLNVEEQKIIAETLQDSLRMKQQITLKDVSTCKKVIRESSYDKTVKRYLNGAILAFEKTEDKMLKPYLSNLLVKYNSEKEKKDG
jgi:formyltetrahydrofolate synthetase